MAQVIWTPVARKELFEIGEFIRKDNREASRRIVRDIRDATTRLLDFPESGRVVQARRSRSVRELIVGNYRIPYAYESGVVRILRVIHGARRIRRADF